MFAEAFIREKRQGKQDDRGRRGALDALTYRNTYFASLPWQATSRPLILSTLRCILCYFVQCVAQRTNMSGAVTKTIRPDIADQRGDGEGAPYRLSRGVRNLLEGLEQALARKGLGLEQCPLRLSAHLCMAKGAPSTIRHAAIH